ncbi:MAG: hypothetical protein JWQ32_1455 [Marmoricola sp.]|nr:hypothetical protein [Marmoricola sp.]
MLVNGALVPPRAALDELADVVRSVRRRVEIVAPAPAPRFGRRPPVQVPTEPLEPPLEDVALAILRLPITGFGNVTSGDAHKIIETIAAAAAEWMPPTVCFTGGAALEFPGDRSVWAKLAGDLDALSEIARGVPQCVERLGFFVDRRVFRPMLSIATVTNATIAADLETVVAALDAFRGQDWIVDSIILTTEAFVGGRSETQELERIPVG